MTKMTDAGHFRTRIMLQAPIETADGQGGVIRSHVDARKIWARVTPLNARDDVVADTLSDVQRLRIEARAPLDLSLQHRLVDRNTIYRIVSYRSNDGIVTIDAETQIS